MAKITSRFPTSLRKDKIDEKDQPKSAGKVILILLIITSGLALLFYFSSLWPSWWQKITAPKVIDSDSWEEKQSDDDISKVPTLIPTPWQTSLIDKIEAIINQETGVYGVYLYKINDQQELGINENTTFSAASLMKLPVIMTVYHQAEKQQFDLSAEYSLKEADKKGGNGSVYLQPAGTTYTYRALAQLAIEQSDNTANYVLAQAVGEEQIKAMINLLNLDQTDYDLYQTSPKDIGQLLLSLYQGEVLTSSHSQEIINYLLATIFNDQIPAALPDDVSVAHKIGRDEELLHDAAIIFGEDNNDFILVIMSQDIDLTQSEEVIKEITSLIWQEINS